MQDGFETFERWVVLYGGTSISAFISESCTSSCCNALWEH